MGVGSTRIASATLLSAPASILVSGVAAKASGSSALRNSGESSAVAEHAPNLKPPRSLWAGRFCYWNRRASMHEMAELSSSPYPFPEKWVFKQIFAAELVDYLVGNKAFKRL